MLADANISATLAKSFENAPSMKLLLQIVFFVTLASGLANGQEFKPYPRADISEAQWQKYFDEVKQKHGATTQDISDQRLLVFNDPTTGAGYAFTKLGHPAHPAWVTRRPEKTGDSIVIGQIGYFAGSERAFAELFAAFQTLTARTTEQMRGRADASSDSAPVATKPIGEDQFELSVRHVGAFDVSKVQAELIGAAKAACGAKTYAFGRYKFSSSESSAATKEGTVGDWFDALQEVSCGVKTSVPQATKAPQDANWKPTEKQAATVLAATYKYFISQDSGEISASYQMLAATMKASASATEWQRSISEFNKRAGASLGRSVSKLTWYPDTDSPSGRGLFVAADFSGAFVNSELFCGYLAWFELPDGTFELVREEKNIIDKNSAKQMKQTDIDAFKSRYCR